MPIAKPAASGASHVRVLCLYACQCITRVIFLCMQEDIKLMLSRIQYLSRVHSSIFLLLIKWPQLSDGF